MIKKSGAILSAHRVPSKENQEHVPSIKVALPSKPDIAGKKAEEGAAAAALPKGLHPTPDVVAAAVMGARR